jgi:hypothetical protein
LAVNIANKYTLGVPRTPRQRLSDPVCKVFREPESGVSCQECQWIKIERIDEAKPGIPETKERRVLSRNAARNWLLARTILANDRHLTADSSNYGVK